jgi:hypothetical protein
MDEYDYVCHLVASRYNQIRDQGGPGFEKKSRDVGRKGATQWVHFGPLLKSPPT